MYLAAPGFHMLGPSYQLRSIFFRGSSVAWYSQPATVLAVYMGFGQIATALRRLPDLMLDANFPHAPNKLGVAKDLL